MARYTTSKPPFAASLRPNGYEYCMRKPSHCFKSVKRGSGPGSKRYLNYVLVRIADYKISSIDQLLPLRVADKLHAPASPPHQAIQPPPLEAITPQRALVSTALVSRLPSTCERARSVCFAADGLLCKSSRRPNVCLIARENGRSWPNSEVPSRSDAWLVTPS